MKNLHYSIEVVNSKDKSKLIDNYTEAVFNILKTNLNSYQIDELVLKIKKMVENK